MSTTSPWLRGAFHELDPHECRDLLATQSVVRVAFWDEDGPGVLPVNAVVDHDGLRFRTSPYSRLARLDGMLVAVEADETDAFSRAGWSVLARGVARVRLGEVGGPDPDPWPQGVRSVTVVVPLERLTGRRVLGH